ncbi:SHOCT domain-containing protein [Leptolyngbya sp. FACHB-261]|uniref:SHOCT domain-containing protein n=1 Tax=Leptolyngbya sp. FACHB-261 TaxID=2692806 RepID=UPI0016838649|nr:SHOCT domain-containing protein [Leptolyngbya sp. FACHB-261]MBD2105322.1 SHOCT domain-containing protein [Leptolyngbya sp. FACHB-261]
MNKEILANSPESNTTVNPWNPLIPTNRDIVRTEELASKNAATAGILSFIFPLAGLIYLNRGINSLKILGYFCAVSFMFYSVTEAEESSKSFDNSLGLIGAGAIAAEQVMAVNKARQRLQEKNIAASASSFHKSEKDFTGVRTNQEAINRLKHLREKYEASEISEEEFKQQKQIILESL